MTDAAGPHAEVVRQLLEEVLGSPCREVPADTPLTALGLDSLRAAELRARLDDTAGVDVPLHALLSGTTLADVLAAGPRTSTPERPAEPPAGQEHGLTPGEESFWFLDEFGTADRSPTTVANAFVVEGPLDATALRTTVEVLAARHPALRTRVTVEQDRVVRSVGATAVALDVVDASAWPADRLDAECARRAATPVRLAGPTWHLDMFRLTATRHLVLVRTHHLLVDLWSLDVLLAELGEVYGRVVAGDAPAPAPGDPDPMGRQAHRERQLLASPRAGELWDHWRERLAGAPHVLALPTDHERPGRPRHRGAVVTAELSREAAARLAALAAEAGVTLASVLLAAYAWLLHRQSGQADLLVGTVFANRGRPDRHRVVGYLANLLPVRLDHRPRDTFRGYLARAHRASCAAMDHGELPFPVIVERLAPDRDAGRAPLVQAVFAFQQARTTAGAATLALGGEGHAVAVGPLHLRPWRLPHRPALTDLALEVSELDGAVAAQLTYDADLFDATTAHRLLDSWVSIVDRVGRDPDGSFDTLTAPAPTESHRLLHEWNGPVGEVPDGELLHHPFERWAKTQPDVVAIVDGRRTVTYGWLDARAERLAGLLRAAGVAVDDRVGVHIGRSLDYVVAVLGVLKAGAAYVPLDPDLPAERLDHIRGQAGIDVVVTAGGPAPDGRAVDVTDLGEPPAVVAGAAPGAGNLCYVMSTSGSTGVPKAVGVPHRAVANLLADFRERGGVPAGARCAWWTSTGFDVSVYEIFAAFHTGATVVVAPEHVRVDGAVLAGWLRDHGIESAFVPPFALGELVADLERHGSPPPMRRLLLGVEPIAEPLAKRLAAVLPGATVVNAYGPTETTVMCTAYEVEAGELAQRRLPIGRALRNTGAYVLDPRGLLVPQGAVGELCVGGAQLARGYLGRPGATAERFTPDPYGPLPGARLYRTGDLVRYRGDGRLEFVGRADQQVKLFGQRVELGEIEAVLGQHPAVAEAVVVVAGTGDGQQVVAHAIPEPAAAATPAEVTVEVLARARESLPRHMVPTRLHWHDAWPLTANGKVDRTALARVRPASTPAGRRAGTWLERQIAATLARELGVAEVGLDDNFFTLGGHSLAAARAATHLRAVLAVELPVAVIFQRPTAGELAEFARRAGATARRGALTRRPRGAASVAAMMSTVDGSEESR
ncbi:amino acid adenylation domain-containing protein [Actinophytocola sp.]|uniref:non-ribosomal peptide synthetase n=1 Tax=Actinophytocola sp. TaxID=1872138 RepID=UPI002ED8927B